MSTSRDARIDSLRVVAMIGVIIFHLGEMWWGESLFFPKTVEQFLSNFRSTGWNLLWLLALIGDHGVPIFLFISSYSISKYVSEINFKWLAIRLKKVLIPYWIALLGGSVMIWLSWILAPVFLDRLVIGDLTWASLIASLFLLQNWSPNWFNAPNPALWFVSILVQSYFLIFLCKFLLSKFRLNKWIWLIGLIFLQMTWSLIFLGWWDGTFMIRYYSALNFVSVIGIGYWWGKHEFQVKPRWGLLAVVLGVICRLMFMRTFLVSEVLIGWGWWIIWLSVSSQFDVLKMAKVGKNWSYIIYLWHLPIIYLVVSMWYRMSR